MSKKEFPPQSDLNSDEAEKILRGIEAAFQEDIQSIMHHPESAVDNFRGLIETGAGVPALAEAVSLAEEGLGLVDEMLLASAKPKKEEIARRILETLDAINENIDSIKSKDTLTEQRSQKIESVRRQIQGIASGMKVAPLTLEIISSPEEHLRRTERLTGDISNADFLPQETRAGLRREAEKLSGAINLFLRREGYLATETGEKAEDQVEKIKDVIRVLDETIKDFDKAWNESGIEDELMREAYSDTHVILRHPEDALKRIAIIKRKAGHNSLFLHNLENLEGKIRVYTDAKAQSEPGEEEISKLAGEIKLAAYALRSGKNSSPSEPSPEKAVKTEPEKPAKPADVFKALVDEGKIDEESAIKAGIVFYEKGSVRGGMRIVTENAAGMPLKDEEARKLLQLLTQKSRKNYKKTIEEYLAKPEATSGTDNDSSEESPHPLPGMPIEREPEPWDATPERIERAKTLLRRMEELHGEYGAVFDDYIGDPRLPSSPLRLMRDILPNYSRHGKLTKENSNLTRQIHSADEYFDLLNRALDEIEEELPEKAALANIESSDFLEQLGGGGDAKPDSAQPGLEKIRTAPSPAGVIRRIEVKPSAEASEPAIDVEFTGVKPGEPKVDLEIRVDETRGEARGEWETEDIARWKLEAEEILNMLNSNPNLYDIYNRMSLKRKLLSLTEEDVDEFLKRWALGTDLGGVEIAAREERTSESVDALLQIIKEDVLRHMKEAGEAPPDIPVTLPAQGTDGSRKGPEADPDQPEAPPVSWEEKTITAYNVRGVGSDEARQLRVDSVESGQAKANEGENDNPQPSETPPGNTREQKLRLSLENKPVDELRELYLRARILRGNVWRGSVTYKRNLEVGDQTLYLAGNRGADELELIENIYRRKLVKELRDKNIPQEQIKGELAKHLEQDQGKRDAFLENMNAGKLSNFKKWWRKHSLKRLGAGLGITATGIGLKVAGVAISPAVAPWTFFYRTIFGYAGGYAAAETAAARWGHFFGKSLDISQRGETERLVKELKNELKTLRGTARTDEEKLKEAEAEQRLKDKIRSLDPEIIHKEAARLHVMQGERITGIENASIFGAKANRVVRELMNQHRQLLAEEIVVKMPESTQAEQFAQAFESSLSNELEAHHKLSHQLGYEERHKKMVRKAYASVAGAGIAFTVGSKYLDKYMTGGESADEAAAPTAEDTKTLTVKKASDIPSTEESVIIGQEPEPPIDTEKPDADTEQVTTPANTTPKPGSGGETGPYIHIFEDVDKGEGLWETSRDMVKEGKITEAQWQEAWKNTYIPIDGQDVHISQVDLVHANDKLFFNPADGDTPARFAFIDNPEDSLTTGTDLPWEKTPQANASEIEQAWKASPADIDSEDDRYFFSQELEKNVMAPDAQLETQEVYPYEVANPGEGPEPINDNYPLQPERSETIDLIPPDKTDLKVEVERAEILKGLRARNPFIFEHWGQYKDLSARSIMNSSVEGQNKEFLRLRQTLKWLSDESNLRPKGARWWRPAESLNDFVERATREMATDRVEELNAKLKRAA